MGTKKISKKIRNKTIKQKSFNADIIKKFLEILNCIKLYHWSTLSYSQHKATDELYYNLNKYIDEFVEIMLGKTKTRIKYVKLKSYNIANKEKFLNIINDFKRYLTNLNHVLNPIKDSNLFNIRDEILGNIDRLLYLFELK